MARTLTALFRRDRSKDRHGGNVRFEGYRIYWPDGRPAAVSLDAFCTHGQRLLGLGRHLQGKEQRLIRLTCFPLGGRDDDLNRLPGHRVRRLFLERRGSLGRLHFMDGTPTALTFDLDSDEPEVLSWIGLANLNDGEQLWFDLSAAPVPSPGAPADEADGRRVHEATAAESAGETSQGAVRSMPIDEGGTAVRVGQTAGTG